MELARIAAFIHEDLFSAHRGVIHLSQGDFLAFGNDGFATDERAKREVAAIRSRVAGQAEEMGFATDDYTWVMLLRSPKGHATEAGQEAFRSLLTLAMWQAWHGENPHPTAEGYEQHQRQIAESSIAKARPRLMKLLPAA
jgi:hypothetical protein